MSKKLNYITNSIQKLSNSFYTLSNYLLKLAENEGLDIEKSKKYFETIISDIEKTLAVMKQTPVNNRNIKAKLSIYYLYEAFKSLSLTGKGINQIEDLVILIEEEVLRDLDFSEALDSLDKIQLAAIEVLMNKYFLDKNFEDELRKWTTVLFGSDVLDEDSEVLTDLEDQTSATDLPEEFKELDARLAPLSIEDFDEDVAKDIEVATSFESNMASVNVSNNAINSALLQSSKEGKEGATGELSVSRLGSEVQSRAQKINSAVLNQKAIIQDYNSKLKKIKEEISAGDIPIELSKQTAFNVSVLEKLISACNTTVDVLSNKLLPLAKEADREYENSRLDQFAEAVKTEEGKKLWTEAVNKFRDIQKRFEQVLDTEFKSSYSKVRFLKRQLDAAEKYRLNIKPWEMKDFKSILVESGIAMEDLIEIQELNENIIKDIREYHLRGKERRNIYKKIKELFNHINKNVNLQQINPNTVKRLVKEILELKAKSLIVSKEKQQQAIQLKGLKDIERIEMERERLSGNLPEMISIGSIFATLIRESTANKTGRNQNVIKELARIFRNPNKLKEFISQYATDVNRALFEEMKYRILVSSFKDSPVLEYRKAIAELASSKGVPVAKVDNKDIIKLPEFKKFIEEGIFTFNWSVIEETFKVQLAKFVMGVLSDQKMIDQIVTSSSELKKLKSQLIALGSIDDFIRKDPLLNQILEDTRNKNMNREYSLEQAISIKSSIEKLGDILIETGVPKFFKLLTDDVTGVKIKDDEKGLIPNINLFISKFKKQMEVKSLEKEIEDAGASQMSEEEKDDLDFINSIREADPADIITFIDSDDIKAYLNSEYQSVREATKELIRDFK